MKAKPPPMIVARRPRRARSAFTSRSAPSYGSPPRTTPSAPERAIRVRERVEALRLRVERRRAGDADPQPSGPPAGTGR